MSIPVRQTTGESWRPNVKSESLQLIQKPSVRLYGLHWDTLWSGVVVSQFRYAGGDREAPWWLVAFCTLVP